MQIWFYQDEIKKLLTAINPGKKRYMASLKPIDSPAVFTNTARLPAFRRQF